MAKQTKITIIGGFLGSGKTTLLKRLVDWEFSQDRVPQVIMSEFGDFDIDGKILEYRMPQGECMLYFQEVAEPGRLAEHYDWGYTKIMIE